MSLTPERIAYLRRVVEDEGGLDYDEEQALLAHIDEQARAIQQVRTEALNLLVEHTQTWNPIVGRRILGALDDGGQE